MNPSNTHHKSNFITLYCDRSTQTMDQDDSSETEESDFRYFPPCRIGNHPPLFSLNGSPLPISTQSRYHMASPSGIQQFSTTSDDEEPPQSQHRRQPIKGLGLAKTGPSQALCKKLGPFLKRRSSTIQDPSSSNGRRLKRRLTLPDDDNMRWVRDEIAGIKETLEEMASEAREDRENHRSTKEDSELDLAGIKESLDEVTYGAKEDRDDLFSMLTEILAEVQQWD